MSLEAGRVPSLLGQEMFRAKVTHYRIASFEDVVISLHDIEHCLEQLSPRQQHLVTRISLQEFTVGEVSAALGVDPRTVINSYRHAIDRLTEIFLSTKILEPLKCCQ
jgi:DNA-directed RNA polymerase specialized sigma24 family protein